MATQSRKNLIDLKGAFPQTWVIQYANGPKGQLPKWADACLENNVGWGGPDIRQTDVINQPSLEPFLVGGNGSPGSYSHYWNYWNFSNVNGHIIGDNCAKGSAVQYEDYDFAVGFDQNYITGTEVLHLNYMFWLYNNTHETQIINYIKDKVNAYGTAGGLNTVAPGTPPDTSIPYVDETFDVSSFAQLDTKSSNESIRVSFDSTAQVGTRFIWGGYCPTSAASAANETQIYFQSSTRSFVFKWGAEVPRARGYTRFDTSTALTGKANASAVQVDASGAMGGTRLILSTCDKTPVDLAILIHNANGWYESSAVTLPLTRSVPQNSVVFPFSGPNAVSWKKCDPNDPGVQDMNEVDNAGEEDITYLDDIVHPILTAIDGMGIIIINAPAVVSSSSDIVISDMIIGRNVVQLPTPQNFTANKYIGQQRIDLSWDAVAGATGYHIYRSATNDPLTPSTQLTTTPVTTLTYSDATVDAGGVYYYMVRAVDSSTPVNESDTTAPVRVKAWLSSAAKKWDKFF